VFSEVNIAALQMQMKNNNNPCWKLGAEVVVLHSWMALRGRVFEVLCGMLQKGCLFGNAEGCLEQ
jgi:hypothetical protein